MWISKNQPTKQTKKQRDFSNQVTKKASTMNVCQHPAQPPLSLLSDSWTKQPWWQGWDQHELSNAEFHPRGCPGCRHRWVSISQQWRLMLSSLRWLAKYGVADWLPYMPFFKELGNILLLLKNTLTQKTNVLSLSTVLPPRLPWLLYPPSRFPTQLCFWTKYCRIPFLVFLHRVGCKGYTPVKLQRGFEITFIVQTHTHTS